MLISLLFIAYFGMSIYRDCLSLGSQPQVATCHLNLKLKICFPKETQKHIKLCRGYMYYTA